MAAHDPDVRRAAAIKANAELWLNLDGEQRRQHMAGVIEGMRRNIAALVDPNGELDEAERERRVSLKQKQMIAAASAKAAEARSTQAAATRRRKADEDFLRMLAQFADLLAEYTPDAALAS